MLWNILRFILKNTYWRDGCVRRILIGPSAGQVYRIFPKYGLAPTFGRWEPDLQRLMVKVISPGEVAYDVGANYGIHTLLMSRLVGTDGRVCAFEPHPGIYKNCHENVVLNGITNAQMLQIGLGATNGNIAYSEGIHEGNGHFIASLSEVTNMTLRCETMDGLVAAQKIPPPDFIKIDVEGFEGNVLAGATETVRKHRPTFAIDLHTPEQDVLVGQFMEKLGYEVYHQNDLRRIRKLQSGWPDPEGVYGSVLGIHPSRTALRLRLGV